MSRIPTTIEEATAAQGEFRAAGTDVQQRLRSGVSSGAVIDLRRLTSLSDISWNGQGRARIGALSSIASLASDRELADAYPGLARSAAALATRRKSGRQEQSAATCCSATGAGVSGIRVRAASRKAATPVPHEMAIISSARASISVPA